MNEEGIPQLLNWCRAHDHQLPKSSRMMKDMLVIQGSLVSSEASFSATRFKIRDHKCSFAKDSLEV